MPKPIQNTLLLFLQEVKRILGKDLKKVVVYGSDFSQGRNDKACGIRVV